MIGYLTGVVRGLDNLDFHVSVHATMTTIAIRSFAIHTYGILRPIFYAVAVSPTMTLRSVSTARCLGVALSTSQRALPLLREPTVDAIPIMHT